MEKYAIVPQDSEGKKAQKARHVMNIKAHLDHLSDNGGRYNLPPVAQKYHGRSIGILKIKESDSLVRIAFYTKSGQAITLLDAIDKPRLYEKGKKLQVDKMIEKFLNRAESYKADYESKDLSIPLTF